MTLPKEFVSENFGAEIRLEQPPIKRLLKNSASVGFEDEEPGVQEGCHKIFARSRPPYNASISIHYLSHLSVGQGTCVYIWLLRKSSTRSVKGRVRRIHHREVFTIHWYIYAFV